MAVWLEARAGECRRVFGARKALARGSSILTHTAISTADGGRSSCERGSFVWHYGDPEDALSMFVGVDVRGTGPERCDWYKSSAGNRAEHVRHAGNVLAGGLMMCISVVSMISRASSNIHQPVGLLAGSHTRACACITHVQQAT